tara:strand:+ start:3381 stop:4193 length:813 start_codon:yes stop_codon:yes gene_type:complete
MSNIPTSYQPVIENTMNINNEVVNQMNMMNNNINILKKNNNHLNDSNLKIIEMINFLKSSSLSEEEKEEMMLHLTTAIKSNNLSIKKNVNDIEKSVLDESNRMIDYENNTKYINYLNDILKSEHNYVNDTYDKFSEEIETKNRQIEINTYYNKKYKRQIETIKGIVFLCAFLIIIVFIFKMNLISEKIFIMITGTWFAILAIYCIKSYYDIYMRDNRKFDEYNFLSFFKNEKGGSIDVSTLHLKDDLDGSCFNGENDSYDKEDGQSLISE